MPAPAVRDRSPGIALEPDDQSKRKRIRIMATAAAEIRLTRIKVDEQVLARIARRVADAGIGYAPDDDTGWKYGVDAAWLSDLRDDWRDRYAWRAAEAAFNDHPQFNCEIDGIPIRFFHFRAAGGGGSWWTA